VAIQAHRITAQGTHTMTVDTTAAPTLHPMAVISVAEMAAASTAVGAEMVAAGTGEEDIDDDPSA